ncbi:adenosine deaminase family protein [Xylariaceae sp. FL1019]|nr:adenosine deaminase family protein [Xylariaceae sp. FL1019]
MPRIEPSSDTKARIDRDFRAALSPVAQQADAIVGAIRQYEIENFWRKPAEIGLEDNERYAGEMFADAKPLIPTTKLWAIVSRMPKGSLLHVHSSAILQFETIFNILLDTDGIAITASQDVSTELSAENATLAFSHVGNFAGDPKVANVSIESPYYVPGTKVPVTYAANSFSGGRPAFIDFLMSKVAVTKEEVLRHDLGVDEIWRKFQACFDPAGSAMTYEPVIRKTYQSVFNAWVDDGIMWVELRSGGSAKLVPDGKDTADPDLDFWIRVLLDELHKFQATEKGKAFWGVRIIWADWRGADRAHLMSNMEKAIERKRRFPDLFSGYDVVAQEDLGRTLLDLTPELLWFQNKTQALNMTYPFFFHAGETLGDGNATDDNLYDALLLDSRRIGHGFSLYKHPLLLGEYVKQNIMVEVCPISNEVLRLATDILHHPIPAMIAHGVATAISNDDPAILGEDAAGLSYDFYQVIQGFDNIGLGGLGALAQNSVRWSNFVDQSQEAWIRDIEAGIDGIGVKGERLRLWQEKWEAYCQWIVDVYADWNVTVSTRDEV